MAFAAAIPIISAVAGPMLQEATQKKQFTPIPKPSDTRMAVIGAKANEEMDMMPILQAGMSAISKNPNAVTPEAKAAIEKAAEKYQRGDYYSNPNRTRGAM